MSVDGLIVNLNRLSHELSGAVAVRERARIESRLADLNRCPECGAFAAFDTLIAPPPVDATEYPSETIRRSVLSDYCVDIRLAPCGHEIDLRAIDGLTVRLRDGPIEVDYSPEISVS